MCNIYIFVFSVFATGISSGTLMSSRIIGGGNAGIGQFPHHVAILVDEEHRCGGSIITTRWILTAAHCIYGFSLDQLQILAGTTKLDQKGELYDVEEGKHHGNWDPNRIENDIALLKTNRLIEFNNEIQPIKLNTQSIKPGTPLLLSGWGYISYPSNITSPNDLQFIILYLIGLEECKEKAKPEIVFDTQLCTLNIIGMGACKGDSGGALIYGEKLVGIVSWGQPCALGLPDIYTDVAQYLDWINEGMQ